MCIGKFAVLYDYDDVSCRPCKLDPDAENTGDSDESSTVFESAARSYTSEEILQILLNSTIHSPRKIVKLAPQTSPSLLHTLLILISWNTQMMSEGTNLGGGTIVVPTCSTPKQRRQLMMNWSLNEYYQARKVTTSSSCDESIASIPLNPTFNVFLHSSLVS